MAGPWERYAATPAQQAGPWTRYAAPAQGYVQPEPPPGEIIHGANRSYISDNPEVNTVRPQGDQSGRDTALTMEALRLRGKHDTGADTAARFVAPFTQGYTMNAGDEIISALFAGTKAVQGGDFGNNFDFAQEYQRQNADRQREEYPITTAASEIAGGVTSGVQLAGRGATLAGRVPYEGLRNLPLRSALSAAEGGIYGGVSGFAGADGGVAERTQGAIDNLPLAIGIGAAAPAVTDLVRAIASPVTNTVMALRNPEQRANELLVTRMAQDSTDPNALASAVENAAAAGQPEYRAVDAAGKNTQRVGAMAAKTPSEARADIDRALTARQQGQGERISGYLDDALGVKGAEAFATEEALINSRKAAAGPLFDAAFRQPPPSDPFYGELLQKPIVQQAVKNMEAAAANSVGGMKEPVNLGEMVDKNGLSVKGWDYVRRYLSRHVDNLYTNANSDDKALAPVYRDLRDALQEKLAADVPGYSDALANYSDTSAALDAIGTGRSLAKAAPGGSTDAAISEFSNLPQGQRDLARIGFGREMSGRGGEGRTPGQDKTLEFAKPNTAMKLEAAVEDPLARALFAERIGREQDMVRGARTMTGGSSTYENIADGEAMRDAGGFLAALMGGRYGRAFGLAAGQAGRTISNTALGVNENVANSVTDYLMSADPQQIRSLADLFQEMQTRATQPRTAPTVMNAGFNAPRTGSGDRKQEKR